MKKIAIGDVFSLKTSTGSIYLQYIYHDETMGELIKVLDECPDEGSVCIKERFMVFFPLTAAFKKGMITKVKSNDIKPFRPAFMRTKHVVMNRQLGWFIINTDSRQRTLVKILSPEQRTFSPFAIWSLQFLVNRIDEKWNLESW